MVGVTTDPEATAAQIACAPPKLSLVVPLILLFDLLTCCCCLWALLVSVPWIQIH